MAHIFRVMAAGALAAICAATPNGLVLPASAKSISETLAGGTLCRTLKDDAPPLKCLDGSFAQNQGDQNSPKLEPPSDWIIKESKSPTGSPEVSAFLKAVGDAETVLMLRCKKNQTDAVFSRRRTYLGTDQIKVIVRIGDGKPIETMWNPAAAGQAAFAPSAIPFIRDLPDNVKLFIKASGPRRNAEGEFNLGNVSEVREKIAKACKWPAERRRRSRSKK
jgi:hypothetical protein